MVLRRGMQRAVPADLFSFAVEDTKDSLCFQAYLSPEVEESIRSLW